MLKIHYDPLPLIAVERFKFNTRMHQPSENIATYISELRQLTTKCNFGNSLNEMLQDQIVCSVNNARIQQQLLAELDLTFKKALQVAQALELADRGAADILGTPAHVATPASVVPIHSIQKDVKEATLGACYRCRGKHHASIPVMLSVLCAGKRATLRVSATRQGGRGGRQNTDA